VENDLRRAADASADLVVRRYFDDDGRLTVMPAKLSRQLAVLDLVAQRFVPGVQYTEVEVNRELMTVFDDYVSLRRGLVDHGLLDRADGRYWRIGGTVPIDAPTTDEKPQGDASADPRARP
jgi:hypothetical protein